jgi:serine/threonine protein phosphatase 1
MGDIHGGYLALLQCLERSKFDKEKDTLIQLGDVADGWSQVPECVEELLTIKNLIPIRGNHDKWTNDWFTNGVASKIWVTQGGKATKDAYVDSGLLQDPKHVQFFRKQHNYHIDDQNRAFVHGGYESDKGLGHETYEADYYWNRDLWSIALSGKRSFDLGKAELPKHLRPHKEIYIGHTTTLNWDSDKPMNACNVWNLDTGGGFGGKLTIMDIDTKEYWQSDPLKDLYPNEKGR